jgi:hypothetical protein
MDGMSFYLLVPRVSLGTLGLAALPPEPTPAAEPPRRDSGAEPRNHTIVPHRTLAYAISCMGFTLGSGSTLPSLLK